MVISHILAISGLHISIVGMAFYKLLRKRRVSYTAAFVCSAALILSYAVMTGNAVSTRRAVGMFILTMLAAALGRCTDMLNSLGIMVIYLLWDNPMVLGYAGFVFSVGAILAIGIVTPVMSAPKGGKFWASVSIQLPMLPVVAMNYYELPLFFGVCKSHCDTGFACRIYFGSACVCRRLLWRDARQTAGVSCICSVKAL